MTTLFTFDRIDLAAPPATVWRLLTDPALTRQYMFGCEALSDWEVGSPLVWRGELAGQPTVFVTGKVVTFQPHRVLAYTTFDPNLGLRDVPENHVTMTCTLTPLEGGGTRLELSQGDFSTVEKGPERYADATQGGQVVLKGLAAVAQRL